MKLTIILVATSLLFGYMLTYGIGNKYNAKNERVVNNLSVDMKKSENKETTKANMQINVKVNDGFVVFELNNSQAAKDLYSQLPLVVEAENYHDNEKIFYPPKKLNVEDTPLARSKKGTLAYYAPWSDVVMFYGDFDSTSGLYELGKTVSGAEYIKNITGTISVSKIE